MTHVRLAAGFLALALLPATPVFAQDPSAAPSATAGPTEDLVDVIAFGSCLFEEDPQVIWKAVTPVEPDVFVFLGDNIYGDPEDRAILQGKYDTLAANEGFQSLRASDAEVIAIWDDHDYGQDDAGSEFPMKVESKEVFLDFWGETADSERRVRDGGVYTSYLYGAEGQRIQIILPDLRWDRSPIDAVTAEEYAARIALDGGGPYLPTTGDGAQMLGAEQWAWLEAQLREPADLRIIGVSVPFLQDGTGWETWANFPDEREKLIGLIDETGANGVVFITGDTHWAQFSKRTDGVPYALWEVNSAGLTENWEPVPGDKNRVGETYSRDNFGLIRVDWSQKDPELSMEIRDVDGALVMQESVHLSELRPAG